MCNLIQPLTVCVLQQDQYAQQPGFFDKAMAYVPSLHSSGYSHPTEELPATQVQTAPHVATDHDTLHGEAQPSLLDKAKAYIPVLGSSTGFDPATEARMGEQDRLYQDTPTRQAGLALEQVPHENSFDKSKPYVPAMRMPPEPLLLALMHAPVRQLVDLHQAQWIVTGLCAMPLCCCNMPAFSCADRVLH